MLSSAADRFRSWSAREEDGRALTLYRRAFALIWLAYDLFDLFAGGTASIASFLLDPHAASLKALQLGLVTAEALLLAGVRPGVLALLCCALRALEATFFFPLNDFYYYIVITLLLSQSGPGKDGKTPAWVRDTLVLQAAWIYLATGFLKLNPEWLSGGHLYVRLQYLAVVHEWPFPVFFREWTSVLGYDAWLAWGGAALELALGIGLALRAPRVLLLLCAVALHLIAAVTVNVWFFGAAMIIQVALARGRALLA